MRPSGASSNGKRAQSSRSSSIMLGPAVVLEPHEKTFLSEALDRGSGGGIPSATCAHFDFDGGLSCVAGFTDAASRQGEAAVQMLVPGGGDSATAVTAAAAVTTTKQSSRLNNLISRQRSNIMRLARASLQEQAVWRVSTRNY